MQDTHGHLMHHQDESRRSTSTDSTAFTLKEKKELVTPVVHMNPGKTAATDQPEKKKGKSTLLSEKAEGKYWRVKHYYEQTKRKMPFLFRKDGIRKKIKTHFFKWVQKNLDKRLQKLLGDKKVKFKKLNQDTISSINLKFNSSLLLKTVYEVYTADCKENEYLIEKLKQEKTTSNTKESQKYKIDDRLCDIFQDYLNNKQFYKDLRNIEKDIELQAQAEPEDREYISLYMDIYKEYSACFVEYFTRTLANDRKCAKNKTKRTDADSNGEKTDSKEEESESEYYF